MRYASRFFAPVSGLAIAAAAMLVWGAGACLAQGIPGDAPVPNYATGGSYSQPYGPQAADSYPGATVPGSSGDISVPMTGGGQITVPEPGAGTSGGVPSSRGAVWSLERTNPNSLGGVPQTGP
jgi:hypothetical protein